MVIRTQPLSSATIAKASRLKIVSRHEVGYDSVDVATLNKRRIPLCIVGDVNSLSVAEHAMMLMLACAKQVIRADPAVRTGPWGSRNRLEAGRPILSADEFACLKPGAIVINTARGGIVDEAALALALGDGRVGAAGLEVFGDEPPAKGHSLLAFDQVVLTPHIAGLTQQAAERMAVSSVQNVIDFFAGRLDADLIVNGDF